jgi:hypothetical protein
MEENNYKVLITTSGIGSRLGELTNYTNKSLIRIGKKPTISYIVERYSDDVEIVITLGYFGKHVREFLQMAYPEKIFTFIDVDKYTGEGSSLGYSLLNTSDIISENDTLNNTLDDTLTNHLINPSENTINNSLEDNILNKKYPLENVPLVKVEVPLEIFLKNPFEVPLENNPSENNVKTNHRYKKMSVYQEMTHILQEFKDNKISLNQTLQKLQLKENVNTKPYCKVTSDGLLSLHNISKQPITLYAEQWEKMGKVFKSNYMDNFIKYNKEKLKFKNNS